MKKHGAACEENLRRSICHARRCFLEGNCAVSCDYEIDREHNHWIGADPFQQNQVSESTAGTTLTGPRLDVPSIW